MTYTKLMKKGEVMEIGYMLPFGVSVPEDTDMTYMAYQMGSDLNDELMRNVYSYQEGMSWRDMVLSLLIAAILSVTSVLFVVTLLLMWVRHRYPFRENVPGFVPAGRSGDPDRSVYGQGKQFRFPSGLRRPALYRAVHAGKHRKRRYAAGRYAGTNGQGGTTGIKRKTPFAGVFRFIRCRLGRLLCASDAAKI